MRSVQRARSAALFMLLGSALACGVASSAGPAEGPAGSAREAIDSLSARCNLAMLRGSCRAMQAGGQSTPRPGTARVFVAGFGEIDRSAYEGFRAQGDAMCSTVAQRCREDWQGKRLPRRAGAVSRRPTTGPDRSRAKRSG